jgi:hypothetical protein
MLFAVFLFVIITGCDPVRTLVIKAADKPSLSVTIFGNKNMLPYNNEAAAEKVIIKIPPDANRERRDTAFRYGLGGWSINKQIPDLVANIDSIIIINSTNKTVLKNKQELMSYLLAHRTGHYGCLLTIEATRVP